MSAIPHIEMIVAAYVLAAVAIALMISWVWFDYRSLRAELAALERSSGDRAGSAK
jgi:heme exporter protein CcmD